MINIVMLQTTYRLSSICQRFLTWLLQFLRSLTHCKLRVGNLVITAPLSIIHMNWCF